MRLAMAGRFRARVRKKSIHRSSVSHLSGTFLRMGFLFGSKGEAVEQRRSRMSYAPYFHALIHSGPRRKTPWKPVG